MKIEEVHIQNFRHIEDLQLSVGDLLALIGPNNIGKSSILKSILAFCEPLNSIPSTDFNEANGYPDIEITVTFCDLPEETKRQYKSRLLDGEKLIVKKKWARGTRKPEFYSKELRPKDKILADIPGSWNTLKNDETWKSRADAGGVEFRLKAEVIEFVEEYIQDHRGEFDFEETWATNPSGLQEILTLHMPELIFVEGVVDVPEQVTTKQGTIFTKILGILVEEALETDENAKKTYELLKNLVSRISQKPLEEVERIEGIKKLEDELSRHMPAGMKAKFIVDATEISFSKLIQQVAILKIDDGVQTSLENKGHGMQRAAIFSLFRTYSSLRRLKESEGQEGEQKKTKRSYLFLVEEPELYLHPQAQRQMAGSFEDLIKGGNQVIFSTHSPSLIDLSKAERVCILQRNSDESISKKQLKEQLFEEHERNRFKLLEYMNPHRSELFFAKRVIFVEGESDRIVLEMLGDYLGVRDPEITIVETGSKDNLPFYIQLAEKFELDYFVMHDEDARDNEVGASPKKAEGECEYCFKRKCDKHRSLNAHPKKNKEIKELIKNGRLITWYPTLNEGCDIPKGRSKGISAQEWCEKVQIGEHKIPSELENAVKKVYELEGY